MVVVAKKKKPLLTKIYRRIRLEFAERHLEWTVNDWKRVWWSDETKINRLGSDERDQVWVDKENRQDHRRMKQTVKFGGGKLMMWGCINWDGIEYATRIDSRIDTNLYTEILGDELLKSLEYYNHKIEDVLKPLTSNTSKLAKKWSQDHDFKSLYD